MESILSYFNVTYQELMDSGDHDKSKVHARIVCDNIFKTMRHMTTVNISKILKRDRTTLYLYRKMFDKDEGLQEISSIFIKSFEGKQEEIIGTLAQKTIDKFIANVHKGEI